ncbi:DctP family TRAP transporter solute-binding subunit [Oceanobacillus kimchii]|uniref:DctP family TRAP transporter solute-binding subunit n=1 Tax=Oceanobacillus kimchii TaxID=746691 RepID=UPI00036596AA|nr:DctP family TRAP transporter solute-binding subunit [Oceanobacillus kimchii]MCT1578354.1 DctP family TRAP transporter solute-binding subunit [Oceanobacillus kimchii]
MSLSKVKVLFQWYKTSLVIIFLFLLNACQVQSYPEDHEQLSEEERIVIRFSHVVGEETPKGLASRKFAELVEERTDGYVEVQVFPNSFLYKDGEEIEALLAGDVQMLAPSTSKITALVPEWKVIDIPFAFENEEEIHDYLNSSAGKILEDKLVQKGFYPLAFWESGFKQVTNNRNALHYPEDFEGLEFRIMSSDILKEQFSLLGAHAQVETFDQVFPLLEQGVLNAQENTYSNIVSKNIHKVQDHLTVSNHGYLGYLVLINDDFWKSLPDEVQVIIIDVMEEVTEWEIKKARELNVQEYEYLQECQCINIHELSDEEKNTWEETLDPLYERFTEKYGSQYIHYLPRFLNY